MTPQLTTRLRGTVTPPGDKSVAHRLALLGAIAEGTTEVERFPESLDCARTVAAVRSLGVDVELDGNTLVLEGVGLHGLHAPATELNCGNSGTTARLTCGLTAPQVFDSRLVGDASLSRRPIARVVEPLSQMGAVIDTTAGRLPVTVHGGHGLTAIDYTLPVPSAQVKTAVLIAGLYASGTTTVREAIASRDHTELALGGFGVELDRSEPGARVSGGSRLLGRRFQVPGDFSSAAFFITAAAFLPHSELVIENVGLNPTRTGLVEVLASMGARIELEPDVRSEGLEPTGTIRVRGSSLHGTTVPADLLPSMIDEVPALAVAAAFADGSTWIEGAAELRVKESDRLTGIVEGLRSLGADVSSDGDAFVIRGGRKLRPAKLETHGDHRMVMAWAIASLGVDGDCTIDHQHQVKISYPEFWEHLGRVAQ